MPESIDGADAQHHLVARLDESRAVGQRQTDFDIEFAIEFARLANVFALLPEIEIGGAEHITRLGKYRLAAFGHAPDVIGMAVGDDDDIDILRPVAGLRHAIDQFARRQTALELLVLGRKRAVAGVDRKSTRLNSSHTVISYAV